MDSISATTLLLALAVGVLFILSGVLALTPKIKENESYYYWWLIWVWLGVFALALVAAAVEPGLTIWLPTVLIFVVIAVGINIAFKDRPLLAARAGGVLLTIATLVFTWSYAAILRPFGLLFFLMVVAAALLAVAQQEKTRLVRWLIKAIAIAFIVAGVVNSPLWALMGLP